jgi:hypothetical protein
LARSGIFRAALSNSSAAWSVALRAETTVLSSLPLPSSSGSALTSRSTRIALLYVSAACTRRAVFSASWAFCQVSMEFFTWKPPITRPTATGMSRIAFSLVGTRQLRGEKRLPLGAGGAVGSEPGTGAGAAPRGGGVKLPRADGSGPFLLRLTRPTTFRRSAPIVVPQCLKPVNDLCLSVRR